MKYLVAAVSLALAAGPALAQEPAKPYAPQDFDFSGLEASAAYGQVESVQPVPRKDPLQADVFEHASRLVIRLDGGAGVTLTHDGIERFEPGQRVRVFLGPREQFVVPAASTD
jgi:hypothetical protein